MTKTRTDKPELPAKYRWVLAVVLSAIIQFCIISYNYYTGFISGFTPYSFLFRWVYGTLLTTLASIILISVNYYLICWLNKGFPWAGRSLKRISIEILVSLLISVFLGSGITLLANAIDAYDESLTMVIVTNSLIASVANILLVVALEAWMFFREGRMNERKAEELHRELTGIRFEVLKNQINPHFLFNSLNVLSGLINKDTHKAQEFIEEFAYVYRYVLDTIEKQVVTLEEEMKFSRAYMFLQKIRYGDSLLFEIHIESEMLEKLLPPLSLQLLLENAIKHNKAETGAPLIVEIYTTEGFLYIRNNLQAKFSGSKSTGIGLRNLKKRYEMIAEQQPSFGIENLHYVAKLPLIEND
ncbi:MAG: histidine kinase [Bacteroidales bacterium]|nr:histidine kinase [Bacteroidales bacterium]